MVKKRLSQAGLGLPLETKICELRATMSLALRRLAANNRTLSVTGG
jgi:hypothetical protein